MTRGGSLRGRRPAGVTVSSMSWKRRASRSGAPERAGPRIGQRRDRAEAGTLPRRNRRTINGDASTQALNKLSSSEAAAAFGVDRRVVQLEVVIEGGLIRLRKLTAMDVDVGRGLDLLFGHFHLEIVGTDLHATERHEGQMTADEAFLDRGKLRYIGLDIDVDILQLADLLAVDV